MITNPYCQICGAIKEVYLISSDKMSKKTLDYFEYINGKADNQSLNFFTIESIHCSNCGIIYHKDSI